MIIRLWNSHLFRARAWFCVKFEIIQCNEVRICMIIFLPLIFLKSNESTVGYLNIKVHNFYCSLWFFQSAIVIGIFDRFCIGAMKIWLIRRLKTGSWIEITVMTFLGGKINILFAEMKRNSNRLLPPRHFGYLGKWIWIHIWVIRS